MKLDSENSRPLYQQLKEDLLHAIQDGVYKRGQKIPTELELSKTYDVSRITVRKALAELTEDGYLERRRGKGTFVTSVKLQRSIMRFMSFTETCEAQGLKPGSRVIKCAIEEPEDEMREQLGLEPGERIILLERLLFADSVPVTLDINHFSMKYSFLLAEDLQDKSLFTLLRNKYGVSFHSGGSVLEIVFASYAQATYLSIPQKYPLLLISGTTIDQEGAPASLCKQYIVGDKFKFFA